MLTTLVVAVTLFRLLMGLTALVTPERIAAIHETRELTAAGRNEVRAVYGGFGVLIAGVLGRALTQPSVREGVLLTAAATFGGMAAGRLVAAAVERPQSFYPSWFYCGFEMAMAVILFVATQTLHG